jgi:hypothetical protein
MAPAASRGRKIRHPDDLLGWTVLRQNVVQTNFQHGFSEKHSKKALRILNR